MTATLFERAWNVAEITVWYMEKRLTASRERLNAAEGRIVRGTSSDRDDQSIEIYTSSIERMLVELNDIRTTIDQFNATQQELGLSDKEYDKRQRNLARKIIGYNRSYCP